VPGPPPTYLYRQYEDVKPIALAEVAAAIVGLTHTARNHQEATTITLCTDYSVVYYVLNTGEGSTLRQNVILQELYIAYFSKKE
jgi:hypothetical protein